LTRILRKLLLIILPVGILIIAANYFIDPANLFSSKEYVTGIAGILLKGHNVDKVSNFDERLLQEQMVLGMKKTPDVIVCGSSRVMEIGSDFFPSRTVLNMGVSHANIQDLIAIIGLLDSMHRLPKLLLINVDPWLVSSDGTAEWQSLAQYHDYFQKKLGTNTSSHFLESNNVRKLLSLLSFDYFKQSLVFIIKGENKQYADIGTERPKVYGRFSDGTVCYSYKYTHPDTLKVASDAGRTATKAGLFTPDPDNVKTLNYVINYLQAQGTEVQLIILPLHHDYYLNVVARQSDIFNVYSSIFRNIATDKKIALKGGFNADDFNLGRLQFYDMYHCSKEAIKKILIN
jgi:hypothetical protein